MNPITVKDAASTLGVSTQRIRQLIERGDLKATRAGARVLIIDARSLRALADKRAKAAEAEA